MYRFTETPCRIIYFILIPGHYLAHFLDSSFVETAYVFTCLYTYTSLETTSDLLDAPLFWSTSGPFSPRVWVDRCRAERMYPSSSGIGRETAPSSSGRPH